MLDQEKITEQLYIWLTTFVEIPHPQLGHWAPCPFARQARITNNIIIKFCEVHELEEILKESVKILDLKEVVIVCFDHNQIASTELQTWVEKVNKSLLMPMGYVALEDHPNAPEYVNSIKMNFDHCGLLIIQSLEKLNQSSKRLREKGYYNYWDQDTLDQIVTWRYK